MNISLWQSNTAPIKRYPKLDQDLTVDVVIIGGGITGVTTAWQLLNSNKKVVVIESDYIGSGTTGNSTGNLYVPVQPYFQSIASKFNEETARQVALSRLQALNYIENIIQELSIQCEFARRPWYLYTNDKDKENFLHKEVEILQSFQLPIEYTDNLPYPLKFIRAATLPNQARMNPFLYVQSLAAALAAKNNFIYENTRILTQLETEDGFVLHTQHGKITAKCVVAATHIPLGINRLQMFAAPYRSYVVVAQLKKAYYPEMQCWDLHQPHHVMCTHSSDSNEPNRLLISGSHHKTGQDEEINHFQQLENFLHENFDDASIVGRWSAQHYHSADTIPYIGAINAKNNYYVATGYFADGLIYGTLAGQLIADAIQDRKNSFTSIYDPRRFAPIASMTDFLSENFNVACQYAKDIPELHHANIQDIKKGEAKVVEIDREKVAVYRDENGELHAVSAVCSHMKCIVDWNNAEKTWDCPCHGSRFTITGKVIEGPALTHLKTKKL